MISNAKLMEMIENAIRFIVTGSCAKRGWKIIFPNEAHLGKYAEKDKELG